MNNNCLTNCINIFSAYHHLRFAGSEFVPKKTEKHYFTGRLRKDLERCPREKLNYTQ